MKPKWAAIIFIIPIIFFRIPAVQNSGTQIDFPQPGDALRGDIEVTGSTDVGDFKAFELAFAYESPLETWFPINQGTLSIKKGLLGNWKTSTIADGRYRIRLRVFLIDGSVEEIIVPGLRVRNYSSIETNTPAPTRYVYDGLVSATPFATRTLRPSPTPLPPNPIELTFPIVLSNLTKGSLVIFCIFIILGSYLILKYLSRNRS
jgi:hypothetical protein